MATAVRAGFVDCIFQAVGDTERYAGRLSKLHGALPIPMEKRQSCSRAWQDKLKNIAGCFDAIIGTGHEDCGQEQDGGQQGGRGLEGTFLCLAHMDLSCCRSCARGWRGCDIIPDYRLWLYLAFLPSGAAAQQQLCARSGRLQAYFPKTRATGPFSVRRLSQLRTFGDLRSEFRAYDQNDSVPSFANFLALLVKKKHTPPSAIGRREGE